MHVNLRPYQSPVMCGDAASQARLDVEVTRAMQAQRYRYEVAPRCSVVTHRGPIRPGEPVCEEEFKSRDALRELIASGRILHDNNRPEFTPHPPEAA